MGHVDPDLMRATGLQPAFQQRRDSRFAAAAAEAFGDGEMRHRMACIRVAGSHDAAPRAVRGAAERRVDRAPGALRRPPDQRRIGALQAAAAPMVGKGAREGAMRGVGLRRDDQPARILVEPVHDARPPHAADPRQAVAAMVDQRVDQRSGPVAGAGMHDEAGRLVDDDQVLVLEDDCERDRLALRHRRLGLRQAHRGAPTGDDLRLGIGDRAAVDCDMAAADQILEA